jgi:hypothetical protein
MHSPSEELFVSHPEVYDGIEVNAEKDRKDNKYTLHNNNSIAYV